MSLSHDIISEFVKVTNNNKEKPKEGIVYATIVQGSDGKYVKIDGSDLLTPADTTTDIEDGERVTVMIKDHKATVTGNVTSPSASGNRVDKVVDTVTEQIGVFETVVADKVSTNELEAYKATIEYLVAGKATIEDLEATNAVIENLKVKDAEIENLVADKATIEDLEATNAVIENLKVKDAEIENAVVENLEATKADIQILNADFAQIKTLVSGNLTSDNILSFNITADKVTMEDAFIKDAMIANVNAAKINAGRINTNSVVIGSEDGGMSISGATQQFTDKNGNVRIQIGRDASDDFTFALYGEDGQGQLINQNGITASAISDGIIVNDMISDDASISGGKLDISSVIMEINDDDSTTIKSNKIYLDEQNQSLEVAFNSLKSHVDTIQETTIDGDLTQIIETVQSNSSKIDANISSIQTLISEDSVIKKQVTDLEGNVVETTRTLTSNYTSLQQDLSGFKTSVGKTYATQSSVNDLNDNLTSNYSTTSAMNSAISQGIGSITSTISETYATKKQVQSIDDDIKANYSTTKQLETAITQAKGDIELSVSETYETKTEVTNKVSDAIKDMQIGGRNLMRYSDPSMLRNLDVTDKWRTGRGVIKSSIFDVTGEKYYWLVLNDNKTDAWACLKDASDRLINFEADTEYTLSFKSYIGQSCKGIKMMLFSSDDKKSQTILNYTKKSVGVGEHYAPKVTFKSSYPAYLCIYNKGLETGTTGQVSLLFREIKIEKGNKGTDWTPAQEDINENITNAESNAIVESKKYADSQITIAQGAIELNVSETYETKTEVTNKVSNAINGLQIGGRNLIIRSTETKDRYVDPSGNIVTVKGYAISDYIEVKSGESIAFSKQHSATTDNYYRWAWYKNNKTYMSRSADSTNKFVWTVPNDATYIRVSYPTDCLPKIERGTKHTDWSPAPEDISADISQAKSDAINSANGTLTTTLESYYTKSETESEIKAYNSGIELKVKTLTEDVATIETTVGNIEIGGVNLAYDTNKGSTGWGWGIQTNSGKTITSETIDGVKCVKLTKDATSGSGWNYVNYSKFKRSKILPSTTYTVSFEIKSNLSFSVGSIELKEGNSANNFIASVEAIQNKVVANSTTWNKIIYNMTTRDTLPPIASQLIYITGIPYSANATHYIRNLKLEKGNKATDWSPAPEDISADISQAKSDAISSANGTLTTTLESYYTKSETESEIKAAKGDITLSVSETYETKTEVSNKVTNAINALQIGGRNLMRYSDPSTLQGVTVGDKWQTGRGAIKVEVYDNEKYYWLVLNDNQTDAWTCLKDTSDRLINFEADTEYTLSFRSFIGLSCKGIRMVLFSSDNQKSQTILDYTKKAAKVGEHYAPKVTFKSSYPAYLCIYNKGPETRASGAVNLLFREIKIEKGNKMTDWSPAPGDIDSSIATAKSSVITECNKYADSQISVAKGDIELNVSKIYETKTTVTGLKNQLAQTKQNIRCNNLGAKINYSSFSATNTGEIYLHGYDSDNNPTDTNGKIYWNGAELSVPKGVINPDSAFPFNTDVYIFMSKSYVNYIYGLYYNTTTKAWAYKPLIGASDSSTNWTPDSRHIALGVFNMASAEQFNHAYLFETPQSLVQLTIGSANLTSRMNTAESKITDTAITNVVKQNFYTKTETNNQITSKGYQTSSQVKQTVDALELKFTQSGGYNLIRNGKAAVDLKCWSSNGGGIQRTTDSVYKTCIKTSLPSGIKYNGGDSGSAIRLKNSTHYVYEAVIYSRTALPGTNISPLHFWCSTSPSKGGTGQCSIVDYRQAVPTVNKWTKCYVHILTAASGEVWFTPFIYTGGSYTGDIWVTEISLSESSVETPYSPHASEIYDGVTTIDKDGVTVKSSSGAYTNFNNLGMNSFNNSGQQTLGIKNGGITFHPYNTNQLGAYITQSALWSGSVSANGLAISTANNGTYISLGTSSLSDANTSLSMDQALTISASDNFQPKGINFWKDVHAHGYGIRQLAHLQLAGSSPIQFDYLNTSPSTIYEATSSGHSLYVMGGYQMHLGCMDGKGSPKGLIWMENSTNTHSYTHWNFHNYTMYNMKTATSYANTLTNRYIETYGINSNVDGIRYLYRNIELVDGVGIRNLPNGYKGCPYDIVSIVCKGRGHAWVECEDEYRFIINGDCKSVNVEIIIYPTDGVMTMSSLAPDESPTLEAIPERNIGEQPVIVTNEGFISIESEQE